MNKYLEKIAEMEKEAAPKYVKETLRKSYEEVQKKPKNFWDGIASVVAAKALKDNPKHVLKGKTREAFKDKPELLRETFNQGS